MTVILVLVTFLTFIVLDYLLNRKKALSMATAPERDTAPALVRSEADGKGWLVTVNVRDEESTTRNLIPKGLVHEWMRLAVDRLFSRQPMLAGAAAADGGRPAEDLLAEVPGSNWKQTTGEFFLTA